jgi:UDP-N-acetylglucosamine acyltransferase
MAIISPHAVVDPKANLADDVEVGPFCVVGPDVTIGADTLLISHVVVLGNTRIGRGNIIHPHAVIGNAPQDLKYKGEPTGVEIGDHNHIRESVTIHCGTTYGGSIHGGGVTRVGNNNLLMVNVHIGHDVQLGSRCVIANNSMIAGHIVIGDNVILNGGVGINAFVTVGEFAYVDAYSAIHHDVPPFVKVTDDRVRALNKVGLKRAGFGSDDIDAIEEASRRLFLNRRRPLSKSLAEFDTMNGINPHVKRMIEFLRRRNLGKHGRYLESLRPK